MTIQENYQGGKEDQPDRLWLLHSPRGRRLLVALLRIAPDALTGTRFQFLRNHPLIRWEFECVSLPRIDTLEDTYLVDRQQQNLLHFLKYLLIIENDGLSL